MDLKDVIIKPIITEKAFLAQNENKYCFQVAKKATKNQIKEAIEKFFNVKVVKINILNVKGKKKRLLRRWKEIKLGDWKKAIVQLKEGDKIDIFPETEAKEKK